MHSPSVSRELIPDWKVALVEIRDMRMLSLGDEHPNQIRACLASILDPSFAFLASRRDAS